jgi:hypothetical protein
VRSFAEETYERSRGRGEKKGDERHGLAHTEFKVNSVPHHNKGERNERDVERGRERKREREKKEIERENERRERC